MVRRKTSGYCTKAVPLNAERLYFVLDIKYIYIYIIKHKLN